MTKYRTCVYIDGFNLYYAAIVHKIGFRPHYPKLWKLCVKKLASFPDEHILKEIHYFTAPVKPTDKDPTKRGRQKKYNRALVREGVIIHDGRFVPNKEADEKEIYKEKQSDVNLASHFLNDAWKDKYDYAVIISNDTDFYGVIKLVQEEFPQIIVDIWTVPATARPLKKIAHRCHRIDDSDWL